MDMVNQSAVREVTRRLHDAVRSDWEYTSPEGSHTAVRVNDAENTVYRERYYGATDEEDGTENFDEQTVKHSSVHDPYKFDDPEDVGDALRRSGLARKARKRKQMENELAYNEGFRHFVQRRNAWTAALPRLTLIGSDVPTSNIELPTFPGASTSMRDGSLVRPQRKTITPAEPVEPADGSFDVQDCQAEPSTTSATSHDSQELYDVLLPVAPPLVPIDNPVRLQMTSRGDSELYEKIVRDTRSPAIPINLRHLTRVIVQGWKDEGNWPPPNTALDPVMTGKKRVQRAIMMRQDPGAAGAGTTHGLLANHRHLRQGVDSVKRVFRLSGSHHSLS